MKKSTKAVLLSALVFPGVGYSLVKTAELSLQIFEKVEHGAVLLDQATITALVSQSATAPGMQLVDIATTIVAVCWLVGIVDSYRLGRGPDRNCS